MLQKLELGSGNEEPFQIGSPKFFGASKGLYIFQASSSLSVWDRKGQVNKQTCLLSWVNSLENSSKRTYLIHQISGENATSIKEKSLFCCEEFCRICYCGAEDEELISPCRCSGSAKYAHQSCLLSWFEMKKDKICELCLYEMNVKKTGFKPLAQVLSDVVSPVLFFFLIRPTICSVVSVGLLSLAYLMTVSLLLCFFDSVRLTN